MTLRFSQEALPRKVLPRGRERPENDESPAGRGFRNMRRRGLEPPPGYPGPGPQPGASTNFAIGARATASIALDSIGVESVRRGRYLVRTHVRRSRGGAEP